MPEQCGYIFELTGNRCRLAIGHPDGEHKWWSDLPVRPPPVATQLERIEQGLDKLLQSHAAMEKSENERWSYLTGILEGMRSASGDMFQKLIVRITDCSNYEHSKLDALDAKLKGTGDGLCDEMRRVRSLCALAISPATCKLKHAKPPKPKKKQKARKG